MNLYTMLQGRIVIDASKTNIRGGLRDATIQIPAGAAGANVAPGGVSGFNVMTALVRKATRFEKVFAITDATTGAVTAKLLVVEGTVKSDEVQAARELP